MQNDKKKDLLLEKAAISYVEQESQRIRAEMKTLKNDPEFQPCEGRRSEFLRLLKAERDKLTRKRRQKRAVQFAGILLAVIVGFTSLSFVFVEAFRVRVLYMLREFQGTHMEIGMGDAFMVNDEDLELAKYLPPGFKVVNYSISVHEEEMYAENDEGEFFKISKMDIGMEMNLDTEEAAIRELRIGTENVMLIEKELKHNYIWNDGDNLYLLFSNMQSEDTLKILENVL